MVSANAMRMAMVVTGVVMVVRVIVVVGVRHISS
jgi:succinate dehydrogenase hydrophobic anchor subunit